MKKSELLKIFQETFKLTHLEEESAKSYAQYIYTKCFKKDVKNHNLVQNNIN